MTNRCDPCRPCRDGSAAKTSSADNVMSLPSLQEGRSTLHRFSKRRHWNQDTYLVPSIEKPHSSGFSDELGLALGIGTATALYAIVYAMWLRPPSVVTTSAMTTCKQSGRP